MDAQLTKPTEAIAQRLNETVISVISSDGMRGFEKAFLIAQATADLKNALTPEYMKPIMQLQGTRLGFKTDKDDEGGYKENVVKNCLIEAVLTGVQPFGNQFNIIAGNCYITKEGFGYILQNFPGLTYEIIPSLPRINADRSSAAIVMKIEWTLKGETKTREIDFAIRMNKFMGADAVIGKAERKARAWLHKTITGIEVGEGDVNDIDHKVVDSKLGKEPVPTVEELNALLEQKMELLNKTEFDAAKRIIANKEENSYRKLFNQLTAKHE